MKSSLKPFLCVALVAAAFAGSAVRAAPASAAGPCWKTLLTDWYDGRIDNSYPLHCYQDALAHLPADVQTYSSAHDDILRALQTAKARLRRSGTKVTGTTQVPPQGGGSGKGSGSGSGGGKTTSTSTDTTPSPGRDPGNGLSGAADKLNPSSPSSLPLPLLILGGLALLLVAAGGAGLLAKRYQGRKPAP